MFQLDKKQAEAEVVPSSSQVEVEVEVEVGVEVEVEVKVGVEVGVEVGGDGVRFGLTTLPSGWFGGWVGGVEKSRIELTSAKLG